MHTRIKKIRESKKLSQAEFSKLLGMGQSTLGMMEVGKRDILDRHIKTICSVFNVSEQWLRTGEGEMFVTSKDEFMEQLASEFDLDDMDIEIIYVYCKMPLEYRKIFRNYVKSLVDTGYKEYLKEYPEAIASLSECTATTENTDEMQIDSEIEREVAAYRLEMETKKKGIISLVLGKQKEG